MSVPSEKLLARAGRGQFICVRLNATGDGAVRLKRMGVCEGRELEVIATGDPTIVRVCGSRIGLSQELAKRIVVRVASSNGSD